MSWSSDNLGCLFEVGRVPSGIWNFSFFWQYFKLAFKWLNLFLFLLFHSSKNEWVFKQWHVIHGFTFHFWIPSFWPKAVFWIWTNVDFISLICLSRQSKYHLWYQRGSGEERKWLWLLLHAYQSPLEFLAALKTQHNQKAKGLWSQENLSVNPKSSIYNQSDYSPNWIFTTLRWAS